MLNVYLSIRFIASIGSITRALSLLALDLSILSLDIHLVIGVSAAWSIFAKLEVSSTSEDVASLRLIRDILFVTLTNSSFTLYSLELGLLS